MPYEVSFTKRVALLDREDYINDCCVGGDAVVDRLSRSIKSRYTDVQSNQEDWGWFIWFSKGDVGLAIDIFTDDSEQGAFRIHLTSRRKRFFLFDSIVDTPELEELRRLVEVELNAWDVEALNVARVDRNDM
jgi:hypothetical protein